MLKMPCLIGDPLDHLAPGSLPIWLPLDIALVHHVQVGRRLAREPVIDFVGSGIGEQRF
jgi:hypothetical protein